jgi:SnoaL-like domain
VVTGTLVSDAQSLCRLVEDYGRGFDLRDEARFMRIWAADAVWRPGAGIEVAGVPAISTHVRTSWSRISESTHLAWITDVSVDGEEAAVESSGLVTLRYVSGEVSQRGVWNRDTFVRVEGEWKLSKREVESGMKVTLESASPGLPVDG